MFEQLTQYSPLGFAVFRIIVGGIFVSHAIPKIKDPEGTMSFFGDVGLPDTKLMVYLAILIEVAGGTLLAVGLWTHAAALVLTSFMIIATYISIVEMDKDFEGGYEVDLLLLGASFLFYLAGAGRYALDALL